MREKKIPIIFCSHISIPIIAVLLLLVMAALPVASAATTTYDYSSGAGTNKWAYLEECSVKPPSGNSEPNTEFSSGEYNNINENDGTMQENEASVGSYAAHRFNFTISENIDSISQIYVFWNGIGLDTLLLLPINGATLYIWNYDSGSYEQLNTTSDENEVDLTGTITSNIGNYMDANGHLIILVEQNSKTSTLLVASKIYTDYSRLTLLLPPP